MNLLILGPQGSGKGTQGKMLAQKLDGFYFDSGAFHRKIAESNPQIGEKINKGELVPDDVTFSLVSDYLEKRWDFERSLILDGFPRTLKQYRLLSDWLASKGQKIDRAVLLTISEEETVRRLSGRRICSSCGRVYNLITNPPPGGKGPCGECGGELVLRDDDKPQAIKARLAAYRETTQPLVDFLRREGILMEVDSERPIEVIFNDILQRLGVSV